jgi:hypothetical protein
MPTPPMDLEIGPTPIKLVPFVARTGVAIIKTNDRIEESVNPFLILSSSFKY